MASPIQASRADSVVVPAPPSYIAEKSRDLIVPPAPDVVTARTTEFLRTMCDHSMIRYRLEVFAEMQAKYLERLEAWRELKQVGATSDSQPKPPEFRPEIPIQDGEGFAKILAQSGGCVPKWRVSVDPQDPKRTLFTVYDGRDNTELATARWNTRIRVNGTDIEPPAVYTVTDAGKARLNPVPNPHDRSVAGYLTDIPTGIRRMMEEVPEKDALTSGHTHYFQTYLKLKDGKEIRLKVGKLDQEGKRWGIVVYNGADLQRPLAVAAWDKGSDGPIDCVVTKLGREQLDLARCASNPPVTAATSVNPSNRSSTSTSTKPVSPVEFEKRVAAFITRANDPNGDPATREIICRSEWLRIPSDRQITERGWMTDEACRRDLQAYFSIPPPAGVDPATWRTQRVQDLMTSPEGQPYRISWSGLKAYLSVAPPAGDDLETWRTSRVRDLLTSPEGRVGPDLIAQNPAAVERWKGVLYHWIENPHEAEAMIRLGQMRK